MVYGITWFIIQRDQGGGGDGNFHERQKLCDNLYGVMRGYQFTTLRKRTLALHLVYGPFAPAHCSNKNTA